MGETFLDRHGIKSGIKLNDVIEDFKYVYKGQEVKAGDFVNYINGVASKKDYGESVDTQLSDETYTGQVISAVALDENRVFIAHSNGSSQLLGNVVKIDGATITLDTSPTRLATIGTVTVISACLLPNGKVFIAHNGGSNYLYCVVVTIDGTTILGKTNKTINDSTTYTGATISTCVLRNGNVFIAHSYSTNYHLYGIVVTVSDTDIAFGTDTALVSSTNAGYTISTCLLPNGNVFIAHSYGSSYHLYGIVVSISGTTITKGSDIAISATNNAGDVFSLVKLDDTRVFMSFRDSGNVILQAIVCTISGTSISKGTITDLSSVSHTAGGKLENLLLPNGDVLIIHSSGSNYSIAGMICNINGTAITAGTDVELISLQTSARQLDALLLGDIVFIAHINNNTNYYLYAQIFGIDYENNIPTNHIVITEYEQQVTPAIEPPFNAVALSSGVGAPEFVEVTKTDNIIPTSDWVVASNERSMAHSKGYSVVVDYSTVNSPIYMFDNNAKTDFRIGATRTSNVTLTCPTANKITKMKTYITWGNDSDTYWGSVKIQGSKDNEEWIDLYEITTMQTELTEITLSNTDYYTYYRIANMHNHSGYESYIYEWQVSEYIAQIPSTEHNEQVKIARVYKEVEVEKTFEGNIFPTSWNEEVAYTKYSSDDGYIIEADSTLLDSYTISKSYFPYYVCDGSTTTGYWASEEGLTHWFMITCPKPIKITKMKLYEAVNDSYVDTVYIQGAKEGEDWVNLYSFTALSQELVEITLNNTDFYSKYRIYVTYKQSAAAGLYEWQTSEYIEKVTEVIQ